MEQPREFGSRYDLKIPTLPELGDDASKLVAAATEAESDYQHLTADAAAVIRRADPLGVMATLSFYCFTKLGVVNPWRVQGKPFMLYHAQFFQALALQLSLSEYGQEWPFADVVEDCYGLLYDLAEAARVRHYKDRETRDSKKFSEILLQEQIRSDRHRNRSALLYEETRDLQLALTDQCDAEFRRELGITPRMFVEFLQRLRDSGQKRFDQHLDFLRLLHKQNSAKAAHKLLVDRWPSGWSNIQQDYVEQLGKHKSSDSFQSLLLHLTDARLPELYSWRDAELQHLAPPEADSTALLRVVNALSLEFGSLRDRPADHFYFDNPVLVQPFIRANDLYHLPLEGTLLTSLDQIIERLIELCPSASKRLSRLKGGFLEDEVFQTIEKGLPGARLYRGSLWQDSALGEGENDLLAQIDSYQLIVEAKSGRIPRPALWGNLIQFRDALSRLVVEPAHQAERFSTHLSRAKNHKFSTATGATNEISTAGIQFELRITVLLEELGVGAAHSKPLREAGLLKAQAPAQPTFSLPELRLIFRLLSTVPQRLHYLKRRTEIDTEWRYSGDELDLLAVYLETGFNLSDVPPQGLNFYGFSNRLEHTMRGRPGSKSPSMPLVRLRPLWRLILSRLELMRPDGWLNAGVRLLTVEPAYQRSIEKRLQSKVRGFRRETQHMTSDQVCGSGEDATAFVVFPYSRRVQMDLDGFAGECARRVRQKSGARSVFVIGADVERPASELFHLLHFQDAQSTVVMHL